MQSTFCLAEYLIYLCIKLLCKTSAMLRVFLYHITKYNGKDFLDISLSKNIVSISETEIVILSNGRRYYLPVKNWTNNGRVFDNNVDVFLLATKWMNKKWATKILTEYLAKKEKKLIAA